MRTCTKIFLAVLLGNATLFSQTTQKEKMLKERNEYSNRTKFQQFEKDLVPSAEERLAKKQKIRDRRERLLHIIDTSDIKLELKMGLKDDIVNNPFSKRLRKFMEENDLRSKILKD